MTPVSLAPVAPAVRAADAPTDTARGGDSDKFEALLARASGARAGNERDGAPARRKGGTSPDEVNDPSSAPTAESPQPISAPPEAITGLENLIVPTDQAQSDEPIVVTPCPIATTGPVATVVPAAVIAAPAAALASTNAQPSDEPAASAESTAVAGPVAPLDSTQSETPIVPKGSGRSANAAKDALATTESVEPSRGPIGEPRTAHAIENAPTADHASPDEPSQDAPASHALRQESKADAQTAIRPVALPAIVKSASWAAAATALREALQKSAVATQESQSVPPQTQASATTPTPQTSGPTPGAATVATLVLPNGRFGLTDVTRAEPAHGDATGAGFGETVAATVTAAAGAGERQQSAGAHSDLSNGSTAGYKAPLKHAGGIPVFTAPAAFARALESAAPAAAPPLPPSFTSASLSSVGPQIVKGLQLQVTAGGGDMRLTLTPENLGTVSIEVRVEHDRVRATMTADTPAVRQWIATHQEDLRQGLSAAGLTLDDLVVKEDGQQGRQEPQDDRPPSPQKRRTSRADNEPAFEVVV